MGLAQGVLLKEQMTKFLKATNYYLVSQVTEELPGKWLPPAAVDLIDLALVKGMNNLLDKYAEFTDPFTPQSNFDEMRGLADGSGIDYDAIHRLNLFPEVSKASCSFFGAWGEATTGGKTFQLRALDYITDAKSFTDNPLVIVYHPSAESSVAHASVAWPGTVGVLTGFSAAKLGISEIGVYFSDDSFGQGTDDTPPEKVKGQPWMSVLKDVASKAHNVDEALKIIEDADRTCNLIIGVGDGNAGSAYGVEYSGYVAVPYNDTTLLPVNDTWHPQIPSVVYNGMDWDCPTYTQALGEQLAKFHGSIDETTIVHDILPTVQTGNLHVAVADLTDMNWHISFARRTTADPSEPMNGYERQFSRLHMSELFALPAPTV